MSKIIYTHTDEAPALATYSFLPIIEAFAGAAGVSVETRDISLAGRVLSNFPENLTEEQIQADALAELGELTLQPDANIIKLPNISASVPQLEATIAELQASGYNIPDYPSNPLNDLEKEIQNRYDKIKGSAVNPVLREGNSDRRAPKAVKSYAQKNPHSMGIWSQSSQTHVSTMSAGDFRHNEQSFTSDRNQTLTITFHATTGSSRVLKTVPVLNGEVVDATFLSMEALTAFLEVEMNDAKAKNVLFSLHMKATMMKVSDPIIFGYCVKQFFKETFNQHAELLAHHNVNVNNGFASLVDALQNLTPSEKTAIETSINIDQQSRPALAMVDSDRGITGLHVPSDIIVDASMPAMIRESGRMWNPDGELQDAKAVIPDSSYAGIYQVVIEDCQKNGAYDPTTMGSVANIGLMAQKAEEYGSHDKTFEMDSNGTVSVTDESGSTVLEHAVESGDIWRMCNVKDEPIKDWVKLAVTRGRAANEPVVFWLDESRPHDAQLIQKIRQYLPNHDTDGIDIEIMSPVKATQLSIDRIRKGLNTISVTGNVLRDYNTDLFPILELGTSAKMLSIVPLMNGGGLFETGAGGSAPKHVQQFEKENHLRWDSLGEFLALAVSLEHLAATSGNTTAQLLAETLDIATGKLLDQGKSPSRKVNELDNRGSHFYIALWWAEAISEQKDDLKLAAHFRPFHLALMENESEIVDQLIRCQGNPMDVGGYYFPDPKKAALAMRPSDVFNVIISDFNER